MLSEAGLYAKAVRIIATALYDCSHPTLTAKDHAGNAGAILARLAQADILIEADGEEVEAGLSEDDIAEILQALAETQETDAVAGEQSKHIELAWYFTGRAKMASEAAFLIRKKLHDNTEKNSGTRTSDAEEAE